MSEAEIPAPEGYATVAPDLIVEDAARFGEVKREVGGRRGPTHAEERGRPLTPRPSPPRLFLHPSQ